MRKDFRRRLRTIGYVTPVLVVAASFFLSLYLSHRQSQSMTARGGIDPDAFAAIDQASLEPPIGGFFKLLDSPGKIIGRPVTEFAELFALSREVLNMGSVDRYEFFIPSTREQEERLSGHGGLVRCWPVMAILVKRQSRTIQSVRIYAQCF